jgi:phosphonate transport system substrate-binding protein
VFQFLIDGGKLDGKKVRVFHVSAPYLDYVWVARKDLSKDQQQQFARALLELKEGKNDAILKILRARHFVIANDEEYQITRQVAHEQGMF